MKTIEFHVEGMTCGGCASKISKTLNGQEGVEKVDVDLASKQVRVAVKENHVPGIQIKKSIEACGFQVTSMQSHSS
jgi:copper chaperone CopZ